MTSRVVQYSLYPLNTVAAELLKASCDEGLLVKQISTKCSWLSTPHYLKPIPLALLHFSKVTSHT